MKQVRVIAITMMLMLISTLALMLSSVASSTSSEVMISSWGKVSLFDENGTNDYVYLGAWLNGKMPDILENWTSETGKGLAIYATFAALSPQSPVSGYYATLIQRLTDALPWMGQGLYSAVSLTWMTTFTCNSEDTGPNGTALECTQNVASGQYDNVIREDADWIKSNFSYPLIIRLDHEFDIPHISGWGKDPAVYVAAWKRIVDIFRQENVSQVEWCWSPNFNSDAGVLLADYYPGDDYVDWVGVSLYANTWGWSNADEMLRATGCAKQNPVCPYEFALVHNKPFMIAEWGLNITDDMSDGQNAVWLQGMFSAIETRPNIRMMIHWGTDELYLLNYPEALQIYRSYVIAPNYSAHYP
jgi:hypothetical protein